MTRVSNRDGTVDINMNRDGATERLLHIDSNAPVLRPARQSVEQVQPVPTVQGNQQDWGPFAPAQALAVVSGLAPRNIVNPQGADGAEHQRMRKGDRSHGNDFLVHAPGTDALTWEETHARENAQAFTTGDPDLDRLAAALFSNDEAAISRVSAQIERSPQVQAFEQWGRDLVAAQQRAELPQQEMARQRGPVMRT